MVNALRTLGISVLVIVFSGLAFAGPVAPPPSLKQPGTTSPQEPPQAEVQSPCTMDLDAGWLVPLKTASTPTVRTSVPHPVNCEGAVLKSVTATGKDAVTTFQFTVGYKPGHDRTGILSFAILDDSKRPVATGEARETLKEGANTLLSGSLKIKEREFDRIFAAGNEPALRVTLRLENN
jgi:hypothetical protein